MPWNQKLWLKVVTRTPTVLGLLPPKEIGGGRRAKFNNEERAEMETINERGIYRREKGGGPFIAFPLLNSSLSAPQYSPLFLHQEACIDRSARKTVTCLPCQVMRINIEQKLSLTRTKWGVLWTKRRVLLFFLKAQDLKENVNIYIYIIQARVLPY